MLLHREPLLAGPVLRVSQAPSTHHITSGLNIPSPPLLTHPFWMRLQETKNTILHPPGTSTDPPNPSLPHESHSQTGLLWASLSPLLPRGSVLEFYTASCLGCRPLPFALPASYSPQHPPTWMSTALLFCSQTDLDLSSCATSTSLTLGKLLTF